MNIMIVGVGGQGTLLASRIIGNAAINLGQDVKVSEVHGMSQRGGSVVTYVKYGEDVHSPIIDEGQADIILAFEELEAYRWVSYLKPGGTIIVNARAIDPMPVITGAMKYPENILSKLEQLADKVVSCDALALAEQAGNAKAVNVVLIGVLARSSNVTREQWMEALRQTVPPKFLEVNLKAFELGYAQG